MLLSPRFAQPSNAESMPADSRIIRARAMTAHRVSVTGGTGYIGRRSFAGKVPPADTFVQLVSVAHPGPTKAARRCGLVTLPQMVAAIERAVEAPARGVRIVEVPEIRSA